MGNRSIRDEKQGIGRAGAPGRGSLFGKKPAPAAASQDSATRDISVQGAAAKLGGRKRQIDKAIEDAGG